jgi:hypothetical protein
MLSGCAQQSSHNRFSKKTVVCRIPTHAYHKRGCSELLSASPHMCGGDDRVAQEATGSPSLGGKQQRWEDKSMHQHRIPPNVRGSASLSCASNARATEHLKRWGWCRASFSLPLCWLFLDAGATARPATHSTSAITIEHREIVGWTLSQQVIPQHHFLPITCW